LAGCQKVKKGGIKVKKFSLFILFLLICSLVYSIPKHERNIPDTIRSDFRKVANSASNPDSARYTLTLTVVDSGKDSTLVYDNWPYTGTTIIATKDSTVGKVYCYAGYMDATTWKFSRIDSLSISTAGTYLKTWSIPVGAMHFYIRFDGATGNGHSVPLVIYLRRER
jgi:hypothetical protein